MRLEGALPAFCWSNTPPPGDLRGMGGSGKEDPPDPVIRAGAGGGVLSFSHVSAGAAETGGASAAYLLLPLDYFSRGQCGPLRLRYPRRARAPVERARGVVRGAANPV